MPSTRALQQDKGGVQFYLQSDGKRTYPDFVQHVETDFVEHLRTIRELELRSDDVIVCGYPKSGNHWNHEIMSMVMNQSTNYAKFLFAENLLEMMTYQQLVEFAKAPSPRIVSTHLNIDTFPRQFLQKRPKVVYLVRNVKDVAVSTYEFIYDLKRYVVYKGKWEDFLEFMMAGTWAYGCWFEHVKNAEDFMRDNPDYPFHVMCYEKLKQDPVNQIANLCRFLGKPETLAPKIAEETSFKTMKEKYMKEKQGAWEKQAMEEGGALLKKGTFGRWKERFTKPQSEWVDAIFQGKLSGTKLGDMLKPYM